MSQERRHLLLEIENRVALVTLNRPERLNAYTAELGHELFSLFAELDRDDAVRAIIVTGAGRAFCAGADLAAGGATFAGAQSFESTAVAEARVQPWRMRKPIIAAINGPAVGIGATLPLQWDLRVMSDRAKIGFIFVRRGVMPEANSTWLLPRLVGMAKAMDFLLTGRLIGPDECLASGLVSRVLPHDKLLDETRALAEDIALNTAPVSVAITKRLLWQQLAELDPAEAKTREDALFHWLGAQPDAAEGITAFLEKRAPAWKMSPTGDLPQAVGDKD